jgi:excisionase family DNA binding protein
MSTLYINAPIANDENSWTDENWVAEYLKIKPNTLRKQRSVGKNYIPFHKIGGLVRYNKLEVKNYVESKLHRSEND